VGRNDLLTLSLYQLLASNRSGIFIVYFPLFLVLSKGASVPVALAFVSAAYVAASLLGPVAGRMSDRVGRRRPFLLIAEAGALPLFIAIPYVPGYVAAGLVFLAAQVVLSIGSPALNAYVTDLTRSGDRGAGYGLLNGASSAGGVVGFIVAAVLIQAFGLAALFWFVAVVMVGTFTVVLVLVPDRRIPPSPQRQPLREFRSLAIFSTAVSIRSLGAAAVGTFYGILAFQLGATPLEISGIAIAGLLAGAVSSVPFGRLVDKRGEIRGIWYGTLVTLLGIGIYLAASTWIVIVPAQVLRYLGFALLNPGMLAYVANRAPPGHRAEHMGVFSLVNSTFWSLGPLAGGIALTLGGKLGLFVFALGATGISLVAIELLYLTRRGRAGRVEHPAGAETAAAALGAPTDAPPP
jgi:MFS family permease